MRNLAWLAALAAVSVVSFGAPADAFHAGRDGKGWRHDIWRHGVWRHEVWRHGVWSHGVWVRGGDWAYGPRRVAAGPEIVATSPWWGYDGYQPVYGHGFPYGYTYSYAPDYSDGYCQPGDACGGYPYGGYGY